MKDIGIVGLPYSGKSTLFTALTRAGVAGGRSNIAVDVPDERLDVLTRIESSRKTVPAKVRFIDVPGGLTPQGIAEFRQTDALALVVRAFGPDAEPTRELTTVQTELLLADLTSVDSGLERARRRAKGASEAQMEVAALEKAHVVLQDERPLVEAELDAAEQKVLKGFGLLTMKPWIVVANTDEIAIDRSDLPDGAIALSASLEAEVAGMDLGEAAELLTGFGIEQPGLDRVISACYRALDLITFLTTGEDETRAWEVRRGAKAPEAAGVIHSDLQRGFIRAEVVSYDDLVQAGSWAAAKARGLLRVEGKDYAVTEGDVVHV
ncbi:MAG: YchF family ATPase, partial [Actinomycetota bacterium]|nr:YchF family ATPase [Actinomycetota bacterium]